MKYLILSLAILSSCYPKKFSAYKYETFIVIEKTADDAIVECITCDEPIEIYMIATDSIKKNDTVQFIEKDQRLIVRKTKIDRRDTYNNIPVIKRNIKSK